MLKNLNRTFAVILIIFSIILITQIYNRPVDRDEGFWIGSAHLLNRGYELYRDIPLPHTPLTTLLYALLFKVTGTSLIAGRFLSVALAITSLTILYLLIRTTNESSSLPLYIFSFSYLTINWLSPVKVYSLTILLLIISIMFLILSINNKRLIFALLSGFFTGLVISSRIILIPIIIIPIYCFNRTNNRWNIYPFLSGLIAGIIPIIFYTLKYTDYLLFNVIGIHTTALSGYKSQMTRFSIVKEMALDPNSAIIVILAVIAIFRLFRRRTEMIERISSLYVLVILIISIIPISASLQYLVLLVPFTAISSNHLIHHLTASRKKSILITTVMLFFIITGLVRPLGRVAMNYYAKPMVGISEIVKVQDFTDEYVDEDDVVATWWSGYVTSGIPHPDLLLGEFSRRISDLLTEEERTKYHLPSHEEQCQIILNQKPQWVILGIDSPDKVKVLIKDDYYLFKEIGEVEIYAVHD